MTHKNLVHKIYSCALSNEDSGCKSCSGQRTEKARHDPSMAFKVKSKKEVLEAHRGKNKVHFATLMDICHVKNAELEPKITKTYTGGVVLRGDTERRLWGLRSFY